MKVPTFLIQTMEERKTSFGVICLGASGNQKSERLLMEEFTGPSAWKGSGGRPGIYQCK